MNLSYLLCLTAVSRVPAALSSSFLPQIISCVHTRTILQGPLFPKFFEKIEMTNFEVASDAFSTFKDLLTRHKPMVALYLKEHYDEVSHVHQPQ